MEQVARKCGYPNAQSFTRAFTGAYGLSPTRYRAEGAHVAFRQAQHHGDAAAAAYTVEVRHVPAVQLAGIAHRGPYMQVGRAFEVAFTHMAAGIGIPIGAGRLSVEYRARSPAARAPTGGWRRAR